MPFSPSTFPVSSQCATTHAQPPCFHPVSFKCHQGWEALKNCVSTIHGAEEYFYLLCLPGLCFPAPPLNPLHACTCRSLFLTQLSPVHPASFNCSGVLNLFHLRTPLQQWKSNWTHPPVFLCRLFDPPPTPTPAANLAHRWQQNGERPCLIWCVLRRDKWNYSAAMQGFQTPQ